MRLTMNFAVAAGSTVLWLGGFSPVGAVDIADVLPTAIDQPQVVAVLRRSETGEPLSGTDTIGSPVTAISGFYDTGASGVMGPAVSY